MGKLKMYLGTTIYADHVTFAEGIFTWIFNTCKLLQNGNDKVTVLSKIFRPDLETKLKEVANIEEWDIENEYVVNNLIFSFDFVQFPSNITWAHRYNMIHCDYSSNVSKEITDFNGEFLAVSQIAADAFAKRYNVPCKTIESFVFPHKPKRFLELVSCSRIYSVKGANRMYEFADELDANGIYYRWINYTEIDRNGAKFLNQKRSKQIQHISSIDNDLLLDIIAKADYLIQFSEAEGYCYAVHEALSVGTPVICTDIPIFREIIQNGVNGYLTPLNIDTIVNKIPKDFVYRDDIDSIKNKWNNILQ